MVRLAPLAVVAALLGAVLPAGAQGAGAADTTVSASPARVTVGDTIVLGLRFALPPDATPVADTPITRDTLPGGVRLRALGTLHRAGGTWVARAAIALYRPGVQQTPPFAVPYRRAGVEGTDTAVSGTARITVARVLPDTSSAMRDIKPLADLPGASTTPWWLVVVAVLTLAAVVAVMVRARRRARARVVVTVAGPPPPSAYEEARARLVAVQGADWTQRDVAPLYDEVTAALRRYLEDAHGVRAMRRTTSELARALPTSLAADGRGPELRALLARADLVKFARLRPSRDEAAAFTVRALTVLDAWHAAAAPAAPERASTRREEAGAVR